MTAFHLDPLGGIAGDMFIAAMLDLRPDLEAGLRDTLALCPMIENVKVELVVHNDGILTGRHFLVNKGKNVPVPHVHVHRHDHHHHDHHGDHGHDHAHVAWRDIRIAIEQSRLSRDVVFHAIGIFTLLAEAEARVHGTTPDNVAFHEVGAWDSITDIVGAAYLIAQLGASGWTAGALPLGSGRVKTAHGLLPVPAPATALLIAGFYTIDDGIGGERVTPTGAAILRYLCREPGPPTARKLVASGHGFGAKRLPGISNCLRVLSFETAKDFAESETIAVIEFETDDQTAEDLAHAVDHLRAHEAVLDVVQSTVFGKKGRMMAHIRLLVRPDALQSVARRVFEETSTIGFRYHMVQRLTLPREAGTIESEGSVLRIKTATRPGGETIKIEADDLAGIAGKAARDAIRAHVARDRSGS